MLPGRGEDGPVLVGRTLAPTEVQRPSYGRPGTLNCTVAAVIAHEVAHIDTFERGARLTGGAQMELAADSLAGWAFATAQSLTRLADPNVLGDGVRAFFERGDYAFNRWGRHGTPRQRAAAFLAGYRSGGDLDDAHDVAGAFD